MAVAKSYQALEIVEEPYIAGGKTYVKVRMKNGSLKQVRWYTDAQYAKMYGEAVAKEHSVFKSQKEILGFQKGYITIFKGDTYSSLEWFKESIARYTKFWGWYIMSTEEVPADLPEGIEPIQLRWEDVGQENGELKNETAVKTAVENLIYEPGNSEYVGEVGERLDLIVTVTRAFELDNSYGNSTMHTMEDENGNVFIWTTASKNWAVGSEKHIRGTVKSHGVFRNIKQTILTRCMEVK